MTTFSRRTLLLGLGVGATAAATGISLTTPRLTARAADFTIINPWADLPIEDDWQTHLNRGSEGGIDYALGTGTELPACAPGTVEAGWQKAWGNYVRIHFANGWSSVYMHLSDFAVDDGARVNTGDIVGYSGDTGESTGPHLHWHLEDADSVRHSPLDYATDEAHIPGDSGDDSTAPAPSELPTTSTEEDGEPGPNFYARMQNWLSRSGVYDGPVDGEPGPNTWAALQQFMANNHGYTGPVDGEPGPNTWAAVQQMCTAFGYDGPIDGEPGPNMYRAWAKFLNQPEWS